MVNRHALAIVHISAENENDLQKKLFDFSLETAKAPDVITIYRGGSKVIAWLRVDIKHLSFGKDETPKKKKVAKKG